MLAQFFFTPMFFFQTLRRVHSPPVPCVRRESTTWFRDIPQDGCSIGPAVAGRGITLPANILRQFVNHIGIFSVLWLRIIANRCAKPDRPSDHASNPHHTRLKWRKKGPRIQGQRNNTQTIVEGESIPRTQFGGCSHTSGLIDW
jgi:hypothetical protein